MVQIEGQMEHNDEQNQVQMGQHIELNHEMHFQNHLLDHKLKAQFEQMKKLKGHRSQHLKIIHHPK